MTRLEDVYVAPRPVSRFVALVGADRVKDVERAADRVRGLLQGRVIWNVNSTSAGGGVAEMLRALLSYVRGAAIDARWVAIQGCEEFFELTKRLHHALHGSPGDGSPLHESARRIYEQVSHDNAVELAGLVSEGDVVLLHDPQTAGLIGPLRRSGAHVIWRSHIGTDLANAEVEAAWRFLAPYIEQAQATVFTRAQYRPALCDPARSRVIPPSIDAFSPKNQELDRDTVRAILVHAGLVEGPAGPGLPTFLRDDGAPGRVDRRAEIVRLGRAPAWDTPLVVQVSRWDSLKDPVGVMHGFAKLVDGAAPGAAELVLAGPAVTGVADDPEQASVWEQVLRAWHALPESARNRIHLACLPMDDVEENAAIVNALQRHALVVVQKSLQEGFGLTVTEAMWKAKPVLASAVGGIQDQIEHEVHGLLLKQPADLEGFARALRKLLTDPALVERLGPNAQARVRERFLGLRHLLDYSLLVEDLCR